MFEMRSPFVGVLAASAILAAALTAPPAAAANGSITGTVPAAPTPGAAAYYRPAVVAFRLDQPGTTVSASPAAGSRFRLSLPAGLWAVQSPRWVNGQLTTAMKAVAVAGGRTVNLRAGTNVPPVRIASSEWTSSGLAEPAVTGGIDDLLASDMANAVAKCPTSAGSPRIAAVEDRSGRAFAAVQKEIKLGQSRYASAEFRAMAKRAVKSLTAWAPTHSLTGTMSAAGGTLTATAVLINLKTGKPEWTKTYTGPDTGDGFFALLEAIPSDVVSAACKPSAPLRITITGRSSYKSSQLNASADVALEFDASPVAGSETAYSPTEPAVWKVTAPRATSTIAGCNASVEDVNPGIPVFAPTVAATRSADGGYNVVVTALISLGVSLGPCAPVTLPILISGANASAGQTVAVARSGSGSTLGPQTFTLTKSSAADTFTSTLTVTVSEDR